MSQSPTNEDAVRSIDHLIRESEEHERRLEAHGYKEAHDWMFALREVLFDLRRAHVQLSEAYRADATEAPKRLRDLVELLLYEMMPHSTGHLEELEASLEPYLDRDEPADPDPDDAPA